MVKDRKPVCFILMYTALLFVSHTLFAPYDNKSSKELEADWVITNGKIITVDKDFSLAEAVAIKGEKIVAVGSHAEIKKIIGENTKTLDLKGAIVLPGINDTHLHFQWLATHKSSPVLHMGMMGRKAPTTTRQEDKQSMIKAMQELNKRGITSITDPGLDEYYVSLYRELYEEGNLLVRVNILWCFSQRTENDLQKIRDGLKAVGKYTGRDNNWLNVAGLKIGADNLPNDKSAWMGEEYTTGGNGSLFYPGDTNQKRSEAMSGIISHAHDLGYQVGVHVTGDQAIMAVIESFVKAETKKSKRLRHYIIHGDFTPVDSKILNLMVKYDIGVSAQPGLAMVAGRGMEANIGPEVMARFVPFKALIDAGVHVAGGSDAPITAPDWKLGVQSAVLRKIPAGVPMGMFGVAADLKPLNSAQSINLQKAIRMYTIEGAWLDHMEEVKGSIEAGKLADFCILEEDILNIEPARIKDIPTLMTIIGGKIVYNAKPDEYRIQ